MALGAQLLPLPNFLDQLDSCSCAADAWAEDALIQHTMKHEIGHSIGFDEVPGGGGWNQQLPDR